MQFGGEFPGFVISQTTVFREHHFHIETVGFFCFETGQSLLQLGSADGFVAGSNIGGEFDPGCAIHFRIADDHLVAALRRARRTEQLVILNLKFVVFTLQRVEPEAGAAHSVFCLLQLSCPLGEASLQCIVLTPRALLQRLQAGDIMLHAGQLALGALQLLTRRRQILQQALLILLQRLNPHIGTLQALAQGVAFGRQLRFCPGQRIDLQLQAGNQIGLVDDKTFLFAIGFVQFALLHPSDGKFILGCHQPQRDVFLLLAGGACQLHRLPFRAHGCAQLIDQIDIAQQQHHHGDHENHHDHRHDIGE